MTPECAGITDHAFLINPSAEEREVIGRQATTNAWGNRILPLTLDDVIPTRNAGTAWALPCFSSWNNKWEGGSVSN
jgi:hypothetical protein